LIVRLILVAVPPLVRLGQGADPVIEIVI